MSKGIPALLSEALARRPTGTNIRTVRADLGFFSDELLLPVVSALQQTRSDGQALKSMVLSLPFSG